MTLNLRRATVDDAAALARIVGDPVAYPGQLRLPYTNEPMWRARLAEQTAPGGMNLVLVAESVIHGQPEVVGGAGLHFLSRLPRLRHAAMLGVAVAREAQGQGVGTALMQALCDFSDRWMQVLRIQVDVYADDNAAITLYRKFGFEIEVSQRGYALRDGAFVDAHSMARLHPRQPAAPASMMKSTRARTPPAAVQRGSGSGSWTLRGFEATDADAVAALMTRHGVVEDLMHTPWAPGDLVREQFTKPPRDCALVALTQGRIIGYASLAVQPGLRRRHAADLSICVAPEWQRLGVGSALLSALLDWADDWTALLRIELDVQAANTAAMTLLRSFGFEAEGLRRAALLRGGEFVDMHAMARLHPDPPLADWPVRPA
jgi:putative acetyltransferase